MIATFNILKPDAEHVNGCVGIIGKIVTRCEMHATNDPNVWKVTVVYQEPSTTLRRVGAFERFLRRIGLSCWIDSTFYNLKTFGAEPATVIG